MKRAAVPLFKTVVPAITQIPGSLSDVSCIKSTLQGQGWEDTTDHKVISTGISDDISFTNTTTTTTTTTTTSTTSTTSPTSPTLWNPTSDLSTVSYSDSTEIAARLDNIYQTLEVGYKDAHPSSAALVQVVKETTSDPVILNRILKLDSFKRFATTLPSAKTIPQSNAPHQEILPFSNYSIGTQTEDLDFLEDIESSLQDISSQVIPTESLVISPTPPSTSIATPVVIPSSTLLASTTPIQSSTPTSSVPAASSTFDNAQESSDFTEGSAGVPGNTNELMVIAKVIIPMAILAVAAAVALPLGNALNLLKSGFKFLTKALVTPAV